MLSYAISTNSMRVVYAIGEYVPDHHSDAIGLFSTSVSGGTPVQLNPPLPADGFIDEFKIAPGNQWVVYMGLVDETTRQNELSSVPLLGGESNKLNQPLVGTTYGFVYDFKITPNGLGVVYTAPEEEFRVFELYSVDMTGSYHYKLNLPIFTWMSQIHYEIAPDSSHVVYLGDPGEDRIHYLYSASILGGPPVQLNPPLVDHLPLYRQEQIYAQRHGLNLPRQTLARWVELAADWLTPIYEQIRTGVLAGGYVQLDETPVEYLEPGYGKTKQGYLWTVCRPGKDVFYWWNTSRAAACLDVIVPVNFKGTVQCDGFAAYPCFAQGRDGAVTLAGCWAHIRRGFYEAREQSPRVSGWFLRQIQNLYRI